MITKEQKPKLVQVSRNNDRYTQLDGNESYLEFYNEDGDCVEEVWLEDVLRDEEKFNTLVTIVTDWVDQKLSGDDELNEHLNHHEFV